MIKRALLPPGWPHPRGYANGVASRGVIVSVAGQVGWNTRGEIVSDDFVAQVRQALMNIVAVLAEGNAEPRHLVRLTWYLLNRDEYLTRRHEVGAAFREVIGDYDIAMSAVQVAGLVEPGAKVEIEATAIVPG